MSSHCTLDISETPQNYSILVRCHVCAVVALTSLLQQRFCEQVVILAGMMEPRKDSVSILVIGQKRKISTKWIVEFGQVNLVQDVSILCVFMVS